MPQNDVVTLPARPGAAHRMEDIEKLAEAVAKSGMFGIRTKEQALVLMSISQAEGRHPAEAARDYNIIQGRPAKTSEAMMRDFIHAGGRVEWHQLSDDVADATFSHPQGGTIRILWDTRRAATAGLANKDNWRKFPRQMLRSRCVSEGVRTVCPMATSGFYAPEEVRDMPPAALAEVPSGSAADTTAELDQFAAVTGDAEPIPERDILAEARTAAQYGTMLFRKFWNTLSPPERDSIRQHLDEFQHTAKQADDPFGLPPLEQQQVDPHHQPAAGPAPVHSPTDAGQPLADGDVFAELDHQARAATRNGVAAFRAWWKNLPRDDKDLIRALQPEYEQMAGDADAQRGLAV
jgi:hypothetical protein